MTHPGKITFVDEKGETVQNASEVPEAIRFAEIDGRQVPVVRVVARLAGRQRFITEFGPEGQLLRTTVQVKE